MDAKTTTFPEQYEKAMDKINKEFRIPPGIAEHLKKKRLFGLDKYKERAFQSSYENAMSSPVAAHLGDELIDAINYAMHGYYIGVMDMDEKRKELYADLIGNVKNTIVTLKDLHRILPEGVEKDALTWVVDK